MTIEDEYDLEKVAASNWTWKDGRSLLELSWDERKEAEATDPALRRLRTKSRRMQRAGTLKMLRNPPPHLIMRKLFRGRIPPRDT